MKGEAVALRIGENDRAVFEGLDAMQACTARQIAQRLDIPETSARRRLGQLVKAGFVTASPRIAGVNGYPEREYCVTAANRRKLFAKAPWIEVRATKPWKQAAVLHRRAINDFRISLELALRGQSYYSHQFFPHYHYDTADPETPTCIRAPDRRRRTPSDTAVIADFALVVSDSSGKSSLIYGEIDTGEEIVASTLRTRPTIQTKLETYAAWHDNEGYRRVEDTLAARFSGFRVLIVTKSRRRLANIQRMCARLGSSDFIWLATFDRITPGTILDPVWQTGEDRRPRRLLRHCGG